MTRYLAIVEKRLKKLDEWIIKWVPREENGKVDALAEVATSLLINRMVMFPIYLQATPFITP